MNHVVKSLYVEIKREEYDALRARVAELEGKQQAATPAARWRIDGAADPHGARYDCERADLALGDLTDDELANAVFMHGNEMPDFQRVLAGTAKMPIVYLTAAKDRIRWLSRAMAAATAIAEGRTVTVDHSAQSLNMVQEPYACEYGQDNGDGTYSVTIKRMPLPSYMQPVKDWPVKMLYTTQQPALDVSGLVDALQPFADFIEGTDSVWSDDRRISTLDYDFTKLRLGLFRKARAALTAHRAKA